MTTESAQDGAGESKLPVWCTLREFVRLMAFLNRGGAGRLSTAGMVGMRCLRWYATEEMC